jgi:hypothetical protein
MIDFTAKQLSWIVITLAGVGGGGYLTMNTKVDEIDKKIAVTNTNLDYIQQQLSRIENKIDSNKR